MAREGTDQPPRDDVRHDPRTDLSTYPPQPWRLAGDAYVSLWRVPVAALPRVPRGIAPAHLAGQALVGTAWIDYRAPGMLSYHELLSAIAVHSGPRLSVCITEIWVDSPASRAGGRDLWAIPKDLASLAFDPGHRFSAVEAASGTWIATARFARRTRLPFAAPTRFRISQAADEDVRHSPVTATGRPATAAAGWRINPDGPLGYLAGRTPVASAVLGDFGMRFGSDTGGDR